MSEAEQDKWYMQQAERVVTILRSRGENIANVEPKKIAAAIALFHGRFRKKNGTENPSAAARHFGHSTTNPGAVTKWRTRIQGLLAQLNAEREAR